MDIATGLIIFVVGFAISEFARRLYNISRKRAIVLYIWHTLFCIVYLVYTLTGGVADALAYYLKAHSGNVAFSLGTDAVEYIIYFLVHGLQISFLGGFLIFNIIGSIGLFALDASLRSIKVTRSRILNWFAGSIAFFPSASFWSSAIGKDAIAFFSVCSALWAALELRRRKALMGIAVGTMLIVRPHVAAFMVTALALSLFLGARAVKISVFQRVLLVILSMIAVFFIGPMAMDYVGLPEGFEISTIKDEFDIRQSYEHRGGSSFDISGMPLPLRFFTYLFRPLPFEAHNIFAFFTSIENTVLLVLFLFTVWAIFYKKATGPNYGFLWLYVIFATSTLAPLTANLGIASRQKWMILPMLIYLLLTNYASFQNKRFRSRFSSSSSSRLSSKYIATKRPPHNRIEVRHLP